MSSLKQDLTTQVILADGAMGTYYNHLYPEAEELVENENLNNKSRIYDIHKAYIQAGARLLRTNTFASNFNFYPDRDELKANLQAGLQIARDAVANVACDGQVYVAADIGTLYDIGKDFTEVINDYNFCPIGSTKHVQNFCFIFDEKNISLDCIDATLCIPCICGSRIRFRHR